MARTFHGTAGNDAFVGEMLDNNIFEGLGVGKDVATGGALNDRFMMSVDQFIDRVDGGAGEDTIDYRGSSVGLNINLSSGVVSADLAQVSPLLPHLAVTVAEVSNVEDVVGSRFNDVIIGSAADNRLDGGAGSDVIH